ncbi:MAG: transketolase C-terminal domain-containing protein [Thermodesulfobacteriota bacterium]|nr:transketolase C-terminal domain-containing protein [Thermodesulfobacteriota bacterium]
MGSKTVAETIREITRSHLLENNGLLLGQSITAAGWVNNTVPDCPGIVELPMSDVAGAGIAVGASLVGRRPIFVVRFQDFLILNGSPLIFYAAKTKELHGKGAPIFVRAIGAEGIGPVHSGILHSIFMHFPGFRVCSPMTPKEYEEVWKVFMENDDPMIVSEHRISFPNTEEMNDVFVDDADITLYAISSTRFEVTRATQMLKADGIKCNIIHLLWLKPIVSTRRLIDPLNQSKLGLVIDSGYEIAGASQSIAYALNQATGHSVKALGLYDRTKCLCPPLQNAAPNADRIYITVKQMLQR